MSSIRLALDIGGSAVKWGVVPDGADPRQLDVRPALKLSDRRFASVRDAVEQAVRNAAANGDRLVGVGISTTGSVDPAGTVISAGHFEGYKNIAWSALIGEWIGDGPQVVTVNDGRAACWGEYRVRAHRAVTHVHAVVGTGVGGGIVHRGELLVGDSGQAGYLGHIKVTNQPTITCSCGKQGCVETLASAPAIRHTWGEDLETLETAAADGDQRAVEVLRQAGWWLGVGLANAMNVLNPTTVTVGGGIILLSSEISGDPYMQGVLAGAQESAHRRVFASAGIERGELGNDAGLIGAGYLLSR
jgi:glucokinase